MDIFDELGRDTRYALRSLARNPGFSALAVLMLALGIGANTALFSVIDAVLVRPLPFADPERLAMVWEEGARLGFPKADVSPGNYVDWKRRSTVFEDLAAFSGNAFTLTGRGRPERLDVVQATPNLFSVLGARPLVGRSFLPTEGAEGAADVAILSHALWQRNFAGDASVVGRSIVLNGRPHVVIGVMPSGFQFPREGTQLWLPIIYPPDTASRDSHFLRVVGRLRAGRSLVEAQAEMQAIAAQLAAVYAGADSFYGAVVVPLHDELTGAATLSLWLLEAAALLVLLVACGNVAGLLITRGIGRRQEIAVRSALGASRLRILRQLLIEGLSLAVIGGLVGLLAASVTMRSLEILVPSSLRGAVVLGLDWRMIAVGLGVSLVSGALCGLAPLHVFSDAELARDMGGRGTGKPRDRFRAVLVSAEIAGALVVLSSAGLLVRTILNLEDVDPGFRPENVLTARLEIPSGGESALERRKRFYRELVDRVQAIPGVESAGFTTFLPYTNFGGSSTLIMEDRPDLSDSAQFAYRREITPAYLQTIGVPLVSGRFFNESDDAAHPPVVIVTQYVADLIGRDAVGRRIKLGDTDSPWLTIVGVAGNIREEGLDRPAGRGTVYLPVAQAQEVWYFNPRDLAVRVSGNPTTIVSALEREVWSIDKDLAVSNVRVMDALLTNQMTSRRFQATLLTSFAGLALLLAALGVYGLLSFIVTARANEFGLRMALGADRSTLAVFVVRQGLAWLATGTAIGLLLIVAVSRSLTGFLYGIAPLDPTTLAGAMILLLIIGALAALVPVWRVTRIDPLAALREQT